MNPSVQDAENHWCFSHGIYNSLVVELPCCNEILLSDELYSSMFLFCSCPISASLNIGISLVLIPVVFCRKRSNLIKFVAVALYLVDLFNNDGGK